MMFHLSLLLREQVAHLVSPACQLTYIVGEYQENFRLIDSSSYNHYLQIILNVNTLDLKVL